MTMFIKKAYVFYARHAACMYVGMQLQPAGRRRCWGSLHVEIVDRKICPV